MEDIMIIDQLVIICQGCGENRTVNLNPPLIGAAELIEYTKTKLIGCPCGHGLCDIKARFAKDKNEPSMN